jgi:heptose I phosphotransferase
MPCFRWIDPAFRDQAARLGLDDLTAVIARRDGLRLEDDRRGSDVVRLAATADWSDASLVLKRYRRLRPLADVARWAGRGGGWTGARRELFALRELARADLATPRPVACLEQGPWPAQGCLLLVDWPGGSTLGQALAPPMPARGDGGREALLGHVAAQVAHMHAAGIWHGELYSHRVLVRRLGVGWEVALCDLQCAQCGRIVSPAQRAADLAALVATLPRQALSERDCHGLVDAYLAAAGIDVCGHALPEAVTRNVDRLLTRRRVWEVRERATEDGPAVRPLEAVEAGTMWIDRDFRSSLERAGLNRFEAVMSTTQGRQLRALKDRENWRIELHAAHGPLGAYLKKHHVRSWSSWWRAKVGAGPGRSAGRAEARNAARLARGGIAAMRLIAYGEKLHGDGLLESFVLTEELAGYIQLDHYLRQRCAALPARPSSPRDSALDRLVRQVADVASRLHRQGYNHRDLYCCHFFIREPSAAEFQVNLIDLQRVEHRRRFRFRWLVKDLAQLAYSAPRDRIGCRHKLAFIKQYLGVQRLRPRDKRLIRQVLAKQRWMERTLGLHP